MQNRLSERKHNILKAVVEEYIKDAQPVSSGGIQKKYFSEISSATIRSELAALEDMGYGASLQHYNPLIDKAVAERWLINPDWKLIAQMPFGAPLDSPAHRTASTTLHERRIIYSDTEII